MNESMKVLLNLRSLRAACREVELSELQEALEKFTLVVNERIEEAEKAEKEEAERLAKLEQYRLMLAEDGIELHELAGALASEKTKKAKRAPRPAKYKFNDENGDEKTWTGQGRMPKALNELIEQGRSLEEFEI